MAMGLIVFGCVFAGTLFGMYLSKKVRAHHLSEDTKDAMKMALGVVGTLAALVLGLLLASAKSSFDATSNGINQISADLVLLDRALARYGPETRDVRHLLRDALAGDIRRVWPKEKLQVAKLEAVEARADLEAIDDTIRDLSPLTDAQRGLQTRALSLITEIRKERALILERARITIPIPFLIVLVWWFTIIFACLSLFAPRNALVMAIMFACALSVSAAIVLVLELDSPYEGVIRLSNAPLRNALEHIGQ
jgi:hypothetical protein